MFKKSKIVVVVCLVLMMAAQTVFAATLLPTGGSEYDYDGAAWNDTATERSNCYQYAVLKASSSEPKFKIQPGYLSGQNYTSLSENAIITAVENDFEFIGGAMFDKDIYETTANAVPPAGYRKIALVIAPGVDYHWYEQNSDGYWSHKPGLGSVTNLDASNNLISNPQTCSKSYYYVARNQDGDFVVNINYSTFCGYYMVN